jgi:chaperone modulatory protein CbpM
MNTETAQPGQGEAREPLSLSQLSELSGLPEPMLRELVEYEALLPIDPRAPSWSFGAYAVFTARTASRLVRDFELDVYGVSVLLRYVERIDALEAEVRTLRARGG